MSKILSKFGMWFRRLESKMNGIAKHLVAPSARERYGLNNDENANKRSK